MSHLSKAQPEIPFHQDGIANIKITHFIVPFETKRIMLELMLSNNKNNTIFIKHFFPIKSHFYKLEKRPILKCFFCL